VWFLNVKSIFRDAGYASFLQRPLVKSRRCKNCPKGNIRLAFCPVCSYVINLEFEPDLAEYTQAYESSLDFSPFFQHYARSLAKRLIERYNLYDKDIISIGSGRGRFLRLLCSLGNNRGIGFDPSYVESLGEAEDRVKFIKDLYSYRYSSYQADVFVCRQTFEHIHDPKGFLVMLRHAIKRDAVIFFEVLNAFSGGSLSGMSSTNIAPISHPSHFLTLFHLQVFVSVRLLKSSKVSSSVSTRFGLIDVCQELALNCQVK
jgi:hypothetical protein